MPLSHTRTRCTARRLEFMIDFALCTPKNALPLRILAETLPQITFTHYAVFYLLVVQASLSFQTPEFDREKRCRLLAHFCFFTFHSRKDNHFRVTELTRSLYLSGVFTKGSRHGQSMALASFGVRLDECQQCLRVFEAALIVEMSPK
jgi:hypothetical protein